MIVVCINSGEIYDRRGDKKSVNLINNKQYKVSRVVEGHFDIKNELGVNVIYDRRRFVDIKEWRDSRINRILNEVSL